jgi:hypothetical protein
MPAAFFNSGVVDAAAVEVGGVKLKNGFCAVAFVE